MADYGLKILNLAGKVQIDSVYKNYVALASGSISLTVGTDKSVSITNTTKSPIIACKAVAGGFYCHHGFTLATGTYTSALFTADGTFTGYWKEFVEGQVNAVPSYGLVVYNSDEDIVFHSDDTPMEIISVNTGSFAHTAPGGGNYSDETVVSAANNYFILTSVFPYYFEPGVVSDSPPIFSVAGYTRGIKYINSTTVRVGEFQFMGSGGSGYPPAPYDGWIDDYVLIEVKG